MSEIRRGFLAVDPALLESLLSASNSKASTRMSAIGPAWHQEEGHRKGEVELPFLRAAVELTGESTGPVIVRWWSNVLRAGASYPAHRHDGKWAFVYHLTTGAAVHFKGHGSFTATPGQILVFDSKIAHWTDKVIEETPRVSIAGNLHFKHR